MSNYNTCFNYKSNPSALQNTTNQTTNKTDFLKFPLHFEKILQTCYLGYFGHEYPYPPKIMVSACRKTLILIFKQKIKFICHNFLEILLTYCKLVIWGTCYLGMHEPCPPKTKELTCRKIWCLCTCKKSIWSLPSFLK